MSTKAVDIAGQKVLNPRARKPVLHLAGATFGAWTVLQSAARKGGRRYWKCRCACGVIKKVLQASLRSGGSTKCHACGSNQRDLVGETFGKWFVLKRAPCIGSRSFWACQCICGQQATISGVSLKTKNSKGCMACRAKAQRMPDSMRKWYGPVARERIHQTRMDPNLKTNEQLLTARLLEKYK